MCILWVFFPSCLIDNLTGCKTFAVFTDLQSLNVRLSIAKLLIMNEMFQTA